MAVATSEALTAAKNYLSVLQEHGVPVTGIVLYGSHARGEARPDSDIDLLVLLSDSVEAAEFRNVSASLWGYTSGVDIRIEPKAVCQSRYEHDECSPLIEVIRREGIPIAA